MSAIRRVSKEISDIKKSPADNFAVDVSESNLLQWKVGIKPDEQNFNHMENIMVDLAFPKEYPFKAPTMKFRTPIFHPNVDEKGLVSLSMIRDNWKPSIKAVDLIQALLKLTKEMMDWEDVGEEMMDWDD